MRNWADAILRMMPQEMSQKSTSPHNTYQKHKMWFSALRKTRKIVPPVLSMLPLWQQLVDFFWVLWVCVSRSWFAEVLTIHMEISIWNIPNLIWPWKTWSDFKVGYNFKIGPALSRGVDQMVLSNQNYSQTSAATAVTRSSALNRRAPKNQRFSAQHPKLFGTTENIACKHCIYKMEQVTAAKLINQD